MRQENKGEISSGKKERSQKIKKIAAWLFGGTLFFFGVLLLFSNFWSGFSGLLAGIFLMPITYDFIQKKVVFLGSKKIRLLLAAIFLFLFVFIPDKQNYTIPIKQGDSDPQILMDFQADLIKLINDYKEAQIRSVVITQIAYQGAEFEEAEEYAKETSKKWKEVETDAEKLNKYIELKENEKSGKEVSLLRKIFYLGTVKAEEKDLERFKVDVEMGSSSEDIMKYESGSMGEVELFDKEKELVQTDWDMVEIVRAQLPDKSILKAAMTHFQQSAQKSKELIDQYHGQMAEVWNDEAKQKQSRENLFRSLKAASSVGLTIGGGVVFYGDLMAATVAPTVASGLKLAAETTALAFAKTEAVLEVMETGVIVATGDEKNAAAITQAKDIVSPFNTFMSIKELISKPTLADGGNIATIQKLLETAAQEAGKLFTLETDGDKIKINKSDKVSFLTVGEIAKAHFPEDFKYDIMENKEEPGNKNDPKKDSASDKRFFNGCFYKDARLCDGDYVMRIDPEGKGKMICLWNTPNMLPDCEYLAEDAFEQSEEYKKWLEINN